MLQRQSQYDPGFAAFGGGSADTVLHPPVLIALALLVVAILVVRRKHVLIPLLLGLLVIPANENWYVGGIHLYTYRILILVALMRVLASRPKAAKFFAGGFLLIDKLFLVWALYRAIAVILLFMQAGALVGEVAFLLDAIGGYLLLRTLIRNEEDIINVVQVCAVVAVMCAAGMVREQLTGENVFAPIGGRPIPDLRNGHFRAQAVFGHAILAGSFGATTFPMFLWLWKSGKAKIIAAMGIVSSSVMALACASSTPIIAWLGAIGAICLWPIRWQMRWVRWAIVASLIGLQIVMKAPVWFVISHVDIGGGSSWERAYLIDTCIRHFKDWWLIGTKDNMNWGWDMWDQCNQFVSEAETGGLVALGCFIAMFVYCFRKIGIARKAVAGNHEKEWQMWFLGVTMFAQLLAFMGIDYFDQAKFLWFALLAIVPAATMAIGSSKVRKPKPILTNENLERSPVDTIRTEAELSISHQLVD